MKRYPKRARQSWGRHRTALAPSVRRSLDRVIAARVNYHLADGDVLLTIDSPGGPVADMMREVGRGVTNGVAAGIWLAHGGPLVAHAIEQANRAEVELLNRRLREMAADPDTVMVLPPGILRIEGP